MVGFRRILSEKIGELRLEKRQELVLDILMKHQVVRRNAGLAGIEALSPGDPLRGHPEIGILVHDARALSAQFENHRCQILCGSSHHKTAQRRASGEEDDVPPLLEKLSVHHPVALYHSDVILLEGRGNHLLNDLGHGRNIWRRLQCGSTACRDGSHEGIEQKLHWIVPRSDDESVAERLADDLAGRREKLQRGTFPLRPGPSVQLADMGVDLPEEYADFCKIRLLVGFVEILPQCVAKRFFPFEHSLLEVSQTLFPPADVEGGSGLEIAELLLPDRLDAFLCGVFQCH